MSISVTNKKSTDLAGVKRARIVGEVLRDEVMYDMGKVGYNGVVIFLPRGEEMGWQLLKDRVEKARGKYQKGVPFEPSEMLAATGEDFSDL